MELVVGRVVKSHGVTGEVASRSAPTTQLTGLRRVPGCALRGLLTVVPRAVR